MKHVVIDEGSSQAKMCWFDGTEICIHKIPSRVIQQEQLSSVHLGAYEDSCYELEGLPYTVASHSSGALTTKNRAYQISDHNLVLVHEILRLNGFGGEDVSITVTLPVEDFFRIGQTPPINQPLIDRKKKNLLRDITNKAGHALANIVEVKVSPEATPAWSDYLLNDDGNKKLNSSRDHRILVVDMGGTTTDLTIIDGLGAIHQLKSIRGGVFDVAKNLNGKLVSRFNRSDLESHVLDDALRKGSFNNESITEDIRISCKPIEKLIINGLDEMAHDAYSMDAILYVGGGSSLMAEHIAREYQGKTIVGDEFSIARGILKTKMKSLMAASC